ncbi:TPA: MBL fold metallo-hydrolase [Clostridium perfringens]|nr:MBL fold metallo-hydrolase [Clostridium perfringens]
MIPKLYESNGEVLIGSLHNGIKGITTEERNGLFEIEFIYPYFAPYIEKIIRGNIIIADANDKLKNQKFRIYRISKPISGKVTILARHISYDLLRDFIENIEIENQSCEYALNSIFRASQFSKHFVGVSDIINAQNFSISDVDALKAIAGTRGSILDTYGTGAELLRDNTTIKVLNKRGHDNGVTIEYKKNLTGFTYTLDETGLITRIRAFAKKREENEEVIVYSNPRFIDSPKINEYETPFIKAIDFSEEFDEKNPPTPEKLRLLAEKYFIDNKCDIPKMNYKIEFVPLSKCAGYEGIEDQIGLCDLVTIKNSMYNITTITKVIKTKYDFLRDRYESMELGEAKTTLSNIVGSGSGEGKPGPPGQPGKPGADGSMGDFPDSLPPVPQVTATVYGFASIELKWTYESKPYYHYELYASKTENFEPNIFNLIFSGQASAFLHQVKPSETWYYKARAVNSHSKFTEYSTQVKAVTRKVDDMSNYFEEAAIGRAVIGALTADYMTVGILKGHWIDARNLSVTDGNGKRTLDIDSDGNINADINSLNIRGSKVISEKDTLINIKTEINKYKETVDLAFEDVNTAHENLVNEMNGAFKDGILTEAEKQNLKDQLANLEAEKDTLIKEIDKLIESKYLQNTNQLIELIDAKKEYIYRFYVLINAIRETIGEPPLEIPNIPGLTIERDLIMHFPHFSNKFNPAYPDISLIEDYEGSVYLFDGGEKTNQYEVEKYLKNRNINKVDKIFITHSHSDHIESMPYLIEKFGCKELYLRTPQWDLLDHWETVWKTRELHEAMVAKATEVGARIIEINDDITIPLNDRSNIKVFNSKNTAWGNYNNISLGYLFNFTSKNGTIKKLFIQGDMSYQAEDFVGGQNVGKVDLLKLGHHGNVSSNGETWLSHLRPTYSIATLGYPQGNQVKLNTMRAKFVSSKVFLPNDNPDHMSVVINKDDGTITTTAIEHQFYCEWYQRDNGDWYYFKSNGDLAINESLIIGGLKYYFDSNGLCTNPGGETIG